MKKIIYIYLFALISGNLFAQDIPNPDPKRFENEINAFAQWDQKNSFPENAILFVGSSSIRLWKTADAFPEYSVINRGFGGSHTSDVLQYYDVLVQKYNPAIIVFYEGDNDIADGKSVDQVFNDYKTLVNKILLDNPNVKFVYIPIKPSGLRWNFWDTMQEVNKLVKEFNEGYENLYYIDLAEPLLDKSGKPDHSLFLDDKLHLNEDGYAVWNTIVGPKLKSLLKHK